MVLNCQSLSATVFLDSERTCLRIVLHFCLIYVLYDMRQITFLLRVNEESYWRYRTTKAVGDVRILPVYCYYYTKLYRRLHVHITKLNSLHRRTYYFRQNRNRHCSRLRAHHLCSSKSNRIAKRTANEKDEPKDCKRSWTGWESNPEPPPT